MGHHGSFTLSIDHVRQLHQSLLMWLLVRQVHGDVLLGWCRMRANEWGTPVVSRRSFDLQQFWLWAACLVPEWEYANLRSQPLMARLPLSYRSFLLLHPYCSP